MQLAEVAGKVVYVNPKNREIFHIYAKNLDKKFSCTCKSFFPVKKGDAVSGIAQYDGSNLNFTTPPYTIIGSDKESILEAIAGALRGTGYTAKKGEAMYNVFVKECAELKKDMVSLLGSYGMHYNYEPLTYDPFTLFSQIIDSKQFVKFGKYCYKNFVLRNLYLLGLNNKEISGSNCNPVELYEKLIENPYTITSISLDKCDDILMRCGKPVDMHSRDCGKIVRKISDMMDNGWTGVPSQMLLRMFPKLLDYMPRLKDEYGIETEMHTVYLNYAYEVETFMAKKVKEMVSSDVDFVISDFSYTRDDLSPEQIEAVRKSLTSKISIITGCAGTGKSSVIKELVHNLERNGISYRIASFTGKAVSRVREIIGKKEPSTLHMMISNTKGKKKEKETFKCLILDESSMITSSLVYEFMHAYTFDYSIIFVGDVNQLPAIGWGNLFQSMIESKIVPCTVLKTVHRTIEQGNENGILINANRIVRFKNEQSEEEGEEFDFSISKNFKIIPGDIETVKNMLTVLKNNGIGSDKVVIISPYNRDIDTINTICSSLHNGENRSINDWQKKLWRIGDRVICTANNYSVNLMNGSEGIIVDLDVALEQVSVKFAADTHIFKTCAVLEDDDGTKDLNTSGLIHSFAATIHRLQGSEYEYVVGYVPLSTSSTTFLNSNLLYTLITRTKKMIWLIGDIETMIRAATTKPSWRCSNLTKRLTE